MKDEREKKLARLLVNFSVRLEKGEKCLIEATDIPIPMIEELVAAVYEAGGYPFVKMWSNQIQRAMTLGASHESVKAWADCDLYQMKKMDAYIGIRGIVNPHELDGLGEKQSIIDVDYSLPVHMKQRLSYTKWVVLRYPSPAMAMQAKMSTSDFEDYFYRVTTGVDYKEMEKRMLRAKAYMETVDKVRIMGPGTDISFSIKGMPVIPCCGQANIPDGEIYTAPIKDSVNGKISYNCGSSYHGHHYTDISFIFENGKIIEAHCDDDELINKVLDTDEGSRYIGEFALGCNPQITFPMDNTLFDEKIAGSLHFTPGNSYDDCDNGNKSANHWDLVLIQTSGHGGGEIWFDDVLVRKDGVFLHPELSGLNFAD